MTTNRFQYQNDNNGGGKPSSWNDALNEHSYGKDDVDTIPPTKKAATKNNSWDEALNADAYTSVKKKDGGTSSDTTKPASPAPSQLPQKEQDVPVGSLKSYKDLLTMGKLPTLDVLKTHNLVNPNTIANASNNIRNKQATENDLTILSATPYGQQIGLDKFTDDDKKVVANSINNSGKKEKAASDVLGYVKKYSGGNVDPNKVLNPENLTTLSDFRNKTVASLNEKINSLGTTVYTPGEFNTTTTTSYTPEQQKKIADYKKEIDNINKSFNDFIGYKIVGKYITTAGGEHKVRDLDYTSMGKEYNEHTQGYDESSNEKLVEASKRQDHDAIAAKQNINFKNYETGLLLTLSNLQSNFNDNLATGVLNQDQLKLQHANTYGGQMDDLSNAYNNRFDKFPSVAQNNISKVINDEIVKEKGFFNTFTTKNDVKEAVARLNETNPEFINKFGRYIDYFEAHPENLGGHGFLSDYAKSAVASGNELIDFFRSKEGTAISQTADQTNTRHQFTSASGASPTKTVLSNNGTSFIEKENEAYSKWYDPNNLTRIVGSGLPGVVQFAALEELSGGLATGALVKGASVINKVGKAVNLATNALVGSEDMLAGYKAISFTADELKGIRGLTGLAGAQYATSFGENMQFVEDNMKDASHFEKAATANIVTLFQAATFKVAGISPSSMLGVSIKNSAAKEAYQFLLENGGKYGEKELNSFFQARLIPMLKDAGIAGAKFGAINAASEASKDAVGKIFNPKYQSAADYGKIFTEGAILGFVMEGIGGVSKGIPAVHADALYNAGLYKDEINQQINVSVKAGTVDQDRANKMIQAVNTMHNKIEEASKAKNVFGLPLSTGQIKSIAILNLRKTYLNEENKKLAEAGGKSSGEDNKSKIAANKKIMDGIDENIETIQGMNAWHQLDGSNFVNNMDIRGEDWNKVTALKDVNPSKKYQFINDKGERKEAKGSDILNYIHNNFTSDETTPATGDEYNAIVDLDGKTIGYEKRIKSEDTEGTQTKGGDAESEDAEAEKAKALKSFVGLRDDDFADQYFSKEEYDKWSALEKDNPDEAKKLIADKKAEIQGNKVESAVVEVNGKVYEGKNHAEAIAKAKEAGEDISQIDREKDGKFKLADGTIIDRAEAMKRFGADHSEQLIDQDDAAKKADQDYKNQKEKIPEELTPEQENHIKGLVTGDDGKHLDKTLSQINNAEYINEKDLDKAADALYDLWDKVDNQSVRNLIEPLISKIEQYDFRTKTESSTVTEKVPVKVANEPKQKVSANKSLSQWEGNRATITDKNGKQIEGQIKSDNGKYALYDLDGNKVADLGEKALTDRDITLSDHKDNPNPIGFDKDGNVKSITLQLNKVDDKGGKVPDKTITIQFKDPEKALDYAIQLRAEQVGEVPEPEFDLQFQEIQKEVTKEVPVKDLSTKNKSDEKEKQKTDADKGQEKNDVKPKEGADKKAASSFKDETAIGFAPYREKNVITLKEDKSVRNSPEYKLHQQNVIKIAKGLGLKVESSIDSWGGYVDSETGKPVQEVSNVIHVTGDPEKVKLMAALLGKTAPEMQDSVLVGNYDENGNGIEHTISTGSFENAEKALKLLKDNNLQYFTLDTKTGDVIILDTDGSSTQNIINFVKQLKENGINAEHEINKVNADFIGQGDYDGIIAEKRGEIGKQTGFDIDAYVKEAKRGYEELLKPKEEPKPPAPKAEEIKVTSYSKLSPEQQKKLSERINSLKINTKDILFDASLGLPVALYNGAIDLISKAVALGEDVATAIKRGLNHIEKNHRGKWDKKEFNDRVIEELGYRGITINGEDLITKPVEDKQTVNLVNGFYSPLEKTISETKNNNLPAKQWIEKYANSEEAKWTGLQDWLSEQKGNVSKADIQQFLKDNRIEISEIVKGSQPEHAGQIGALKERLSQMQQERETATDQHEINYLDDRIEQFKNKIREIENRNDTKYSQYQTAGEKEPNSYKEILVTLPKKEASVKDFVDRNSDYVIEAFKKSGKLKVECP